MPCMITDETRKFYRFFYYFIHEAGRKNEENSMCPTQKCVKSLCKPVSRHHAGEDGLVVLILDVDDELVGTHDVVLVEARFHLVTTELPRKSPADGA